MQSRFKMAAAAALVLGLVASLGACGAQTANGNNAASGQLSGTLQVATFGGKYKQLLQKYVEPEFRKTAPNVKIVYTESTNASDYTAKAIAEKGSAKGSYDVLITGGTAQLEEAGVLSKLDSSTISNIANLKPEYQSDPYYAPQIYSAITLAYNTNEIKTPPTSWDALFDSKYKGKVGVMSSMGQYWTFAATATKSDKPLDADWSQSFDVLKKLKENDTKFYATNDALATAIQTGEIWLTLSWRARNALLNTEGSQPTADVVPQEGTLDGTYGASIPVNAPNPKAAQAFVNATLAVSAQVGFGEGMGYLPTVTNAKLPEDKQSKLGFTDDESKRIIHISSSQMFNKWDPLTSKWNQEVLNQ